MEWPSNVATCGSLHPLLCTVGKLGGQVLPFALSDGFRCDRYQLILAYWFFIHYVCFAES